MKRFRVVSTVIAASLALAIAIPFAAHASPSGESATMLVQAEKTPPPPQGVSPATKDIPMPQVGGRCCDCPCCMRTGRAGGKQAMMDRPMLGPGMHGPGHGKESEPGHGMQCGPRVGTRRQGGPKAHGRSGIMGLVRHAKELGLSESQVEKLRGIAKNVQLRMIDLKAALAKERIALRDEIDSGKDDMRAVRKHLDKIASLQADMKETGIQALFEAKKLLTDEQKDLLKNRFPHLGARFH